MSMDRDHYAEAQFDEDLDVYLEEKVLAEKNPNYCQTCFEDKVLYDRRGDVIGPCPDCQKDVQVVIREKSRAQQLYDKTGQENTNKGDGFEVVYMVGETAHQLFYSDQAEKIQGWLQANNYNKEDWRASFKIGDVYYLQKQGEGQE